MDCNAVMKKLKSMSNPEKVKSMEWYGNKSKDIKYGVWTPDLRKLSKEIGRNHVLALELWKTGVHDAKVLATMTASPQQLTEDQMENWVKNIDSWGLCDHACGNLFDKTPFAYRKAAEWTSREREYEKRAGFALIAYLAVHDKTAADSRFIRFLGIIKKESHDERNFVKKAVNWALREIGKRNHSLNKAAIQTAKEIRQSGKGKWIAADAIRELQSDAVQRRLKLKLAK